MPRGIKNTIKNRGIIIIKKPEGNLTSQTLIEGKRFSLSLQLLYFFSGNCRRFGCAFALLSFPYMTPVMRPYYHFIFIYFMAKHFWTSSLELLCVLCHLANPSVFMRILYSLPCNQGVVKLGHSLNLTLQPIVILEQGSLGNLTVDG